MCDILALSSLFILSYTHPFPCFFLQPLDKATSSRLETAIKGSQYASKGKSVKITQKVNPSLQGGLIVDFGERSVDLSVSSRVNRLNNLLQQGV
jgi:F-type H+-transporting ATPase subunit O